MTQRSMWPKRCKYYVQPKHQLPWASKEAKAQIMMVLNAWLESELYFTDIKELIETLEQVNIM